MGKREDNAQQARIWYHHEIVEAPAGHPFYKRLNQLLDEAGFDRFCEEQCKSYYHPSMGRPSLPVGCNYRMVLIGYFEGIESDRGIAWRVADSLSLRDFLRYGIDATTPDHATLSKTRRLLGEETHEAIFKWVLHEVTERGLLKGKTIGIDATTLEANAAMKAIVRRDNHLGYTEYLRTLASSDQKDATSLRRMDRKRKKKMSNEDWINPNDPDAGITRMKTGQTRL